MSYVGADPQRLEDLRGAVVGTSHEVAQHRRRISALLAEAGEPAAAGAGLGAVESQLSAAGCEIAAAAATAAADAASGGQTGWRAGLGVVDDALLDVFWVNDLSRVFTGRDINTGTRVGIGGRFASAVFLIPFTKLAKGTKVLKLGDDAAETAVQAATRPAGRTVAGGADVRAALRRLPEGTSKSGKVRVVGSEAQLHGLFDELTVAGEAVDTSRGWPLRRLPDGTTIQLRPISESGGPTIDVQMGKTKLKVHIHPWPPR